MKRQAALAPQYTYYALAGRRARMRRQSTMLPRPIPLQRPPDMVASPCISAYRLYGSVHYELFRLACNQWSPPRPRVAVTYESMRLLKRAPTYLPRHKIAQCSAYRTFGYASNVLLKERPLVPLEAWLSVAMEEPPILFKQIAFNFMHNTHSQCGVSSKSSVHTCLPLAP